MKNKTLLSTINLIILMFFIFACEKKEPKDIKIIKSLKTEIESSKKEIKQIKSTESLAVAINNANYFPEYKINKHKYVKQSDLSDLVNGADGTYISKGVIEAGSLELINKLNKSTVIITVFTVSKDKNASGIYKTEKSANIKPEKIGMEGYYANNNKLLVFWKGKNYIKIEILKNISKDKGKLILQRLSDIINKMIP